MAAMGGGCDEVAVAAATTTAGDAEVDDDDDDDDDEETPLLFVAVEAKAEDEEDEAVGEARLEVEDDGASVLARGNLTTSCDAVAATVTAGTGAAGSSEAAICTGTAAGFAAGVDTVALLEILAPGPLPGPLVEILLLVEAAVTGSMLEMLATVITEDLTDSAPNEPLGNDSCCGTTDCIALPSAETETESTDPCSP
jgi:hypothetical protein